MTGKQRSRKFQKFVGKPVCMVWRDPVGGAAWQSPDHAVAAPIAKCVTIGWVLACDEGALVSVSDRNSLGAEGGRVSVPLDLIEDIHLLGAVKPTTDTDELLYLTISKGGK